EAEDLAGANGQVDAADRLDPAVGLDQAAGLHRHAVQVGGIAQRHISLADNTSPMEGAVGEGAAAIRCTGLGKRYAGGVRALEEVDLAGPAGRRMSGYSRGMLQRIALAQALLGEPELLLMDEPTAGLDPESQWNIRRTIAARHRRGAAVLLCSHNLAEVE